MREDGAPTKALVFQPEADDYAVHGGLAALKQGTFGIVQGGTGAAEAAADLLAQLFRLLTGQAGRVLQQLLGVANQRLKLFQ